MTFVDPQTGKKTTYSSKIISFGLSTEQNNIVCNNMPASNCELYATRLATDIVALPSVATIIVSSALKNEDREMLIEFYTDVIDYTVETVCWIGHPEPPAHLKNRFHCYQSFEELAVKLKYLLLTAHSKQKKNSIFSKNIANCLIILSFIRNYPGIKTRELAEKIEISERSIQRYISTLQAAGEWIEYDRKKRGWILQNNISILFGDHLSNDQTKRRPTAERKIGI